MSGPESGVRKVSCHISTGIDVRLRGKEAKSWLCTWLGRILPRRGDRGCVQHQKAETVWVDDGVWGLGEPE